MDCKKTAESIQIWLTDYLNKSGQKGFVVGVSGGIDSAVVSALCARTEIPTLCLNLSIRQHLKHVQCAVDQFTYLEQFKNVEKIYLNLSSVFNLIEEALMIPDKLAMANTRSRLRMTILYAYAGWRKYLVVGTGNKVEDYGVGFFTKYGDGGVDLSPIAQLTKTQVYDLATYFGIPYSIQRVAPTDGLCADGRTDEDQLGDTYADLEKAMGFCDQFNIKTVDDVISQSSPSMFRGSVRTLMNYIVRHNSAKHKMSMPPVGPLPIYSLIGGSNAGENLSEGARNSEAG